MLGKLTRASLPKEAGEFIFSVRVFLDNLETVMHEPSSELRGRQIAKQMNDLEIAVDSFEHFGIADNRWIRNQAKKLEARHEPER